MCRKSLGRTVRQSLVLALTFCALDATFADNANNRPDYCAILGGQHAKGVSRCVLEDTVAKINQGAKICHPPESPYFTYFRTDEKTKDTFAKCKEKGYDLPDVLRRVCTVDDDGVEQARKELESERTSVKSFIQKTHLAVGLQTSWSPEHRTEPMVLLHTVLDGLPPKLREIHPWTYGLYVAISPDVDFKRETFVQEKDASSTDDGTPNERRFTSESSPTIGIGVLFSRRASFDERGLSLGLGYWIGGDDQGFQFVVSTNLASFPGWGAK